MNSLTTMIKRLSGLQGTRDLTNWEQGFVDTIVKTTQDGKSTLMLTSKQTEIILTIHNKHFES